MDDRTGDCNRAEGGDLPHVGELDESYDMVEIGVDLLVFAG